MIEKTSAYKVGEFTYCTLFDAQCKAIHRLLFGCDPVSPEAVSDLTDKAIKLIVSKKDEIIPILQMAEGAPKGRKPRSDQGKPHAKRKAKSVVETTDANTGPGIKVEGSGKYANT